MTIIVGLGNPGEKFDNTRHNVGFMAVDFFVEKNSFPDFDLSKKYNSLISERPFDAAQGEQNILLAKPQTFMNESGKAVKKITTHYKLQTTKLVVIHDDIDLPLGKFKIVKNRGSAGHKGVESVIKNVGNKNLIRFRVGVQPLRGEIKNSESFVIKNFTEEEQKVINKTIKKIVEALDYFTENGLEKTMNEYNR